MLSHLQFGHLPSYRASYRQRVPHAARISGRKNFTLRSPYLSNGGPRGEKMHSFTESFRTH